MAARKAVSTPVWTSFRPDPIRSLKIPANHLENRRDHSSKKPSVSAVKKRQATKTVASVIAQPASQAVNPGLALARIAEQRNDDRRALRLSQLPARVMSAVKEHKFEIGQVVNFTPGALTLETSIGLYEIVRHLPPEGPENQYRIKSVLDSHERVVRESQIA